MQKMQNVNLTVIYLNSIKYITILRDLQKYKNLWSLIPHKEEILCHILKTSLYLENINQHILKVRTNMMYTDSYFCFKI